MSASWTLSDLNKKYLQPWILHRFLALVNMNGLCHPLDYSDSRQIFKDSWKNGWKIDNLSVYIYDLLIHSQTHEQHMTSLDIMMNWFSEKHMKINLSWYLIGNTEVFFFFFFFRKKSAIWDSGWHPMVSTQASSYNSKSANNKGKNVIFCGLCNFFRTHNKYFPRICEPLKKATKKMLNTKRVTLWARLRKPASSWRWCFVQNQTWRIPDQTELMTSLWIHLRIVKQLNE
jgi:hypothetical protein